MNASCEAHIRGPQKTPFGSLARQVLSLDPGIESVALEEDGRGPRWAWNEPVSGWLFAGTTTVDGRLIDPLLPLLVDRAGNTGGLGTDDNPHPVLFIVLAYSDMAQVVARLRPDAHLIVALTPGIDPYAVGRKLVSLLDRAAQPPVLH